MTSNFEIISKFYHTRGNPGSFMSKNKLKSALKAAGYSITDEEVDDFMKRSDDYYKLQNVNRTIPAHIPLRFTLVSSRNNTWFGDTAYFPSGWKGVYKFVQLYVDAFSRKFFARASAKLNAETSLKILKSIVAEDNNNIFPQIIFTDSGSEFKSVYDRFLKENGIRHVFPTEATQKNKSYLGKVTFLNQFFYSNTIFLLF